MGVCEILMFGYNLRCATHLWLFVSDDSFCWLVVLLNVVNCLNRTKQEYLGRDRAAGLTCFAVVRQGSFMLTCMF